LKTLGSPENIPNSRQAGRCRTQSAGKSVGTVNTSFLPANPAITPRNETRSHRQRISELLRDQIDGIDAHSQGICVQELADQNAALSRQASEATQQVYDLQQQLAALSTDLDAARAVNRSLMAELNRQERNRVRA